MAAKIDTAVKIQSDGNSTWLSPYQFRSECKIDVNFFPFDHQVCDLKFGSWTYHGDHVDIDPQSEELNFSQLLENPAWSIEDVLVWRKVDYYVDQPYPTVTYRFVMRRRILYYLTNLIIPCVIISVLAFLSFCLPAESGERIALVITMLLTTTVYMMLIFNFMPPTSEVIPLVSKFYLACIVEIAVCLMATFLTIRWYYNETPMPKWIHYFVNKYLSSIFGFKQLKCTSCGSNYWNCRWGNHGPLEENDATVMEGSNLENAVSAAEMTEEDATFISSAKRSLAVMSDKVRRDEEASGLRTRWKHASKVADRFFFLLFLALFLITVVLILWNATDSKVEADRKSLEVTTLN